MVIYSGIVYNRRIKNLCGDNLDTCDRTQKLQLSIEEQKNYLKWCCKLNLVWTSPNIPSPVEADEIEVKTTFCVITMGCTLVYILVYILM